MNTATNSAPTAVPTGYSIARCRACRDECLVQARKHKTAGDKAATRAWVGYALYWHVRATRPGMTADASQDMAHARGARWSVRSAAQHAATLARAVAGMNPPKGTTATPEMSSLGTFTAAMSGSVPV